MRPVTMLMLAVVFAFAGTAAMAADACNPCGPSTTTCPPVACQPAAVCPPVAECPPPAPVCPPIPAAVGAGLAAVGFGAILYGMADDAARARKRAAELKASIDDSVSRAFGGDLVIAASGFGGGEFAAAFSDRPEVQAFQAYLASPEWSNAKAKSTPAGGWLSANKKLDPANLAQPMDKLSYSLLTDPATVFRFDGSDLMPSAVGAGSFWKEMTNWIALDKSSQAVADAIEKSWPAK